MNKIRRILLLLILGVNVSGCSVIPTYSDEYGYIWHLKRAPVARDNWHYHVLSELFPVCRGGYACTTVSRKNKERCDMYIPLNAPKWVRKHEEMHCEGWDHQPRSRSEIQVFLKGD